VSRVGVVLFLGLAACGAQASPPTLRAPLYFEEDTRTCEVRVEGERVLATCDDEEVACAPITRGRLLPGDTPAEVWGCALPRSGVEGWRAVAVTHRGGIVLSRGAPAFGSVREARVEPLVPGDAVDELVLVESGEGEWWSVLRWDGTGLADAGSVALLEYAGCSRTVTVRADGDLDVQASAWEEAGGTERWAWSASEARFIGVEPECPYGAESVDDEYVEEDGSSEGEEYVEEDGSSEGEEYVEEDDSSEGEEYVEEEADADTDDEVE
jgi:hypothetical protein